MQRYIQVATMCLVHIWCVNPDTQAGVSEPIHQHYHNRTGSTVYSVCCVCVRARVCGYVNGIKRFPTIEDSTYVDITSAFRNTLIQYLRIM